MIILLLVFDFLLLISFSLSLYSFLVFFLGNNSHLGMNLPHMPSHVGLGFVLFPTDETLNLYHFFEILIPRFFKLIMETLFAHIWYIYKVIKISLRMNAVQMYSIGQAYYTIFSKLWILYFLELLFACNSLNVAYFADF